MHVFDTHFKVLARFLVYDHVAGRGLSYWLGKMIQSRV